jgi:hypothetical protein
MILKEPEEVRFLGSLVEKPSQGKIAETDLHPLVTWS